MEHAPRFHNHDTRYVKRTAFDAHDHDDTYYTEDEIDATVATLDPSAWTVGKRLSSAQGLTDTLGFVTGLDFTAPASSTWLLEYTLRIGCSDAGGIQFGINCPNGTSLLAQFVGSTTSVSSLVTTWHTTLGTSEPTAWCAVVSTDGHLTIRASLVNGAAADSTVSLFGTAVTAASLGSVASGSHLLARRIA